MFHWMHTHSQAHGMSNIPVAFSAECVTLKRTTVPGGASPFSRSLTATGGLASASSRVETSHPYTVAAHSTRREQHHLLVDCRIIIINLAHVGARLEYSCVCVCVSVTALAGATHTLRPQLRYQKKALDARIKINIGIWLICVLLQKL